MDAWRERPGGTVDSAIAPLERAIEISPEFSEAIALLSMVYNIRGVYKVDPDDDWARSRALAKRAYDLNPRSVMANLCMARFATGAGYDWAADIQYIDRALELDPNNSYSYVRKSIYYRYTGRYNDALSVLRRAKELDPLAPVGASEILRILYHQGEYEVLVREGEVAREQFPDYWPISNWLALAYGQLGRVDDAEELIPEARDPNVTGFDINEILILTACGREEEVEALMDSIDYGGVGQRLIPAMILLGRIDEVFEYLTKLETREDAYVRSSLGVIQLQPLWSDDRFWTSYFRMRLPSFPLEHPASEYQQRYLINKRAEELIAERGLLPAQSP